MGDMIAHMTAAKLLRHRLAGREPGLTLHMPAFYLGNLGPDIFYYSLLPGKKSLMCYGDRLQMDVDVAAMLRVAQAEAAAAGGNRTLLFSWFAGLISHYCADRYLHPYVESFVFAHQEQAEGSITGLHGLCESEIDIALHHRQTGRPISTFKLGFLRLSAEDKRSIAEVWRKIIASLFHETVSPAQIINAINTIPLLTFLQLHGTGVTKPAAKWIGHLLPVDYDISTKLKRDHPCDEILNDARRAWRDPRHPQGVYCHSVKDLLRHAVGEAEELISAVCHGGSAADSPLITRDFDFGYFNAEEEVLCLG